MSTPSLNLTTALDDAAAELVLLEPDDAAGWDAARNKILGFADGAPDAVSAILKTAAAKMADGAALSGEQKKSILDEINKLIQEGLEQVWEKANAEIKSSSTPKTETAVAPVVASAPAAPPPPPPPPSEPKTKETKNVASPAATTDTPGEKPSSAAPAEPAAPAKPVVAETPVRRAVGGKFLTFFLDKEEFGFEILRVQEIISQLPITPVPRTPAHVQGVINLRGKIIPVVDLRRKLGLAPLETQGCVIIVRAHNIEVGVAVDQVSEVSTIVDDQIDPAPSFGSGVIGEYLLGIGKIGDRVKLLLDVDRTLAPEHLTGAQAGGQTVVAMNGGGR